MVGVTSAAVTLLTVALLALTVAVAVAATNDDFGFDVSEDLEVEISGQDVPNVPDVPDSDSPLPPRNFKGIPDVTAVRGKLLHFVLPSDAFSGNVVKLQVKSTLPSWLSFDSTTNTFSGVPISSDKSDVLVSVVAHGSPLQETAFDVFRIHVQQQPGKAQFISEIPCSKNPLVLTIFIDKKLDVIKPQQRAVAIHNLAGFLGINTSAFTLGAQRAYSDTVDSDSSVILAGPGNVKKRSTKQTSNIDLLVGCENKLWDKYISLTHQVKDQAHDGTLAEVIGLPVIAWQLYTPTSTLGLDRGRREVAAADDYDDYYEYDGEYDDIDEDDDGEVTTIIPTVPETTSTTTQTSNDLENHPHRHHHGEPPIAAEDNVPDLFITEKEEQTTSTVSSTRLVGWSTQPTTTMRISTITEPASTTLARENDAIIYDDLDEDDDYPEVDESETEVPTPVTVLPVGGSRSSTTTVATTLVEKTTEQVTEAVTSRRPETTQETTTEKMTTFIDTTIEEVKTTMQETTSTTTTTEATTSTTTTVTTPTTTTTTTVRTTPVPPPTTTETPTTTTEEITTTPTTTTTTTTTTEKPTTTTLATTTTTERVTETIEYGTKNFPPTINQRLKKIRITAGTVLSYFIPEDTFTDFEDGTNLNLKFMDAEGAPVKRNSWIQFNERTREIYGLPLEDHVSKWEFIIQATDKEGASMSDKFEVSVQQHKGRRAVTHEFTLHMRIEKKHEFPSAVDWQLRTLRGLASLFHNKDLTQIVVRQIDLMSDHVTFTWTNDTLPRSYCPKAELENLFSIMVANSEGDPSFALSQVLAPELRVKNVEYRGIGQCEEKPEPPVPPPKASPTNFSPIPRNQVDHINATVGELLVFRVPDDTFYDPEDGDARNLKMSLLTIDRQPLPTHHWLQFDVKNQEFFGIPLISNQGRSEYQLVCEDRGGLTANDGLVVVVNPAPRTRYNVEFSMTLDTPYESFIHSASIKRKFVEKLRDLFRDRDTSNIHISSIAEGSTVVSWNNKSLPTDRCPDTEIKRLRQVLVNDDETLADRVEVIMGPEFPVAAISLTPTGLCQGELTVVHTPDVITPVDESAAAETSDEYLITFVVPAVIIAAMLVLAGIVACVLYRRRRTGKMNVEDEERQNFRSKGIPVIFQDEIDEKPESGTKAPVILKEEKPPLAPPEYSKGGGGGGGGTPIATEESGETAPYQPPPPFPSSQDNGRQPRPKPTPTYRKPPPYVPP